MRLADARRVAALALTALTLELPVALAAPVLDQRMDNPLTNAAGFLADGAIDIAQTFTVGLAGRLARLEFSIGRTGDTLSNLTVEVRSVAGGVPGAADSAIRLSTSLATAAVPVFSATTAGPVDLSRFAFVGIDIDALGLDVSIGEQYAITLRSEAAPGGYGWAFAAPDPYAGGHGFFRDNNPGTSVWNRGGADQLFRTYVQTVPVPGTLALVALALLGLAWARPGARAAASTAAAASAA